MKIITLIALILGLSSVAPAQSNPVIPLTPDQTARYELYTEQEKSASKNLVDLQAEIIKQYLLVETKVNKQGVTYKNFLPGFENGEFLYSDDHKFITRYRASYGSFTIPSSNWGPGSYRVANNSLVISLKDYTCDEGYDYSLVCTPK